MGATKRAVILLAPGFEEGETLTVADILRRAGFVCDLAGFSKVVEGSHQIQVECDRELRELNVEEPEYDMVILPGGLPGATNLRDSGEVMTLLRTMAEKGRFVAAICAAPIALERAGLLKNRDYTAYVGYDAKIHDGNYQSAMVVRDGNVITSRGPATAYAFGYALVDALGGDSAPVKARMVYSNAFEEEA
ncbi:MAG: DJ-1 family glyoxalase III [Acutalibacter sp.]|jgi:4-methyl-5(b-hydroxyethyl)-thiazole monophosphate biosynthesis